MPHARQHPLAGYVVVPCAESGEGVYVVDWLDRTPERHWILAFDGDAAAAYRARLARLGLHEGGTVLARGAGGRVLIHHAELPAYAPEPAGCVS